MLNLCGFVKNIQNQTVNFGDKKAKNENHIAIFCEKNDKISVRTFCDYEEDMNEI